ncbi:MAG: Type IV secretion system protein PtlG [Chloroflexi bacterium]|nr:Type IV secretion system protein PtlG [Chloroflexota bacterium]
MPAEKPPVSRKLAFGIGSALIAMVSFGAIIGYFLFAPTNVAEEKAAEEAAAAIDRQEPARISDLERQLVDRQRELEEARNVTEGAQREAEIAAGARGAGEAADLSRRNLPALDPELLEALERADRDVGQRPRITVGTGQPVNRDGVLALGAPGGPSAAAPAAMFEAYDEPSLNESLADARDDSDEPFDTIKPRFPPSGRIVSQGAMIRAVLLSRIDTRNPGEVVAQTTADVFDTHSASHLLIPRGSRLVGTYQTAISPGNPRVAVAFRRLMLPNGQAIELGDMAATGNDGVIGVAGDYRGNLLRSLGPSLMVTLIGAWADEETRPSSGTVQQSQFGMAQAPTVVQQVVPTINEAVLRRFEGAAPYFVTEPGTSIRVFVNADIEIPLETSS